MPAAGSRKLDPHPGGLGKAGTVKRVETALKDDMSGEASAASQARHRSTIMQDSFKAPSQKRDPRLDFFRGIAMFIILVSHTPGNWWINWIPARFGFSDATEIFVFCSGMASAIAFGRIFEHQGFAMGTARILFRAWQVYWAHIAAFLAVAAMLIAVDKALDNNWHYAYQLNLQGFFDNVRHTTLGLLTLTYVPNYFDILPMYFAILLMVPAVMWLRWQHPAAPFVFCAVLWAVARQGWLNLPAEPWSDRSWFFNPFSWQLLFFTGFAFMRGWIPVPPIRKDWLIACGVVLVAVIPLSSHYVWQNFPSLQAVTRWLAPLTVKTEFGLLRYIHFLALAYVAYSAVTALGHRFRGPSVDISRKVGQQSLPVFLASLVVAQGIGITLDQVGHSYVTTFAFNALGFVALYAVAVTAGWFKSAPWKSRPANQRSAGAIRRAALERGEAGSYAGNLAPRPRITPAE
jgi:hypothetical protein